MPGHSHHYHLIKGKKKHIINFICTIFAILMPLTTIPQIVLLYSTKEAAGLSLTMWIMYLIGVIPFLLFGIINKHVQLIILNSLWLVVQSIMITGIVLYK